MYRLFTIFLLYIFTFNTQAQILNADKFGTGVDSSHHLKAVLDFGMNLNKQQTILLSFDTKLDLAYWWKRNLFISVSKFNLFRTGSKNLVNGGYAHLRWRYLGHRLVQPEVFGQYQQDGIRGMRHRALAGANIRLHLWESKKQDGRLDFGLGAMFEYEYWDYSGVPSGTVILDDTPITNEFIKLNSYLSYAQKIGKTAEMQYMIYFQSRPDSYFIFPRISNDISLTFNITKHISFTVKWAMFYDALPPVPVTKLTYSAMNKITFNW